MDKGLLPRLFLYTGDIMAGNTRGRIKEHFEGMHRQFDWLEFHCDKIVTLVDGRKPKLTKAVELLHEEINTLDELTQSLYATI